MQIKFKKAVLIRITLHVLFWAFAWLFFLFYYYRYDGLNSNTILATTINLVVAAITVYTFNYYLIPRFLLRKKLGLFLLYAFIALLLFVYLQLLMTVFLLLKLLFEQSRLFPQMIDVLMLFVNLFFVVFVAISVKFYKRWTEKEQRAQTVQKEKVQAELELLKTQINPHFLFNTLNSIYALALKKSEQTPETVLRLSDILDYILYRVNDQLVPIKQEIDIVKNYIELEKIRFAQRVTVEFNVQLTTMETLVPPMLIIPFVENAFKHGVAKSMSKSWINIQVAEEEDWVCIQVMNSKKPTVDGPKREGIGIKNTLQRLHLIFNHQFDFSRQDAGDGYKITLKIPKNKSI